MTNKDRSTQVGEHGREVTIGTEVPATGLPADQPPAPPLPDWAYGAAGPPTDADGVA